MTVAVGRRQLLLITSYGLVRKNWNGKFTTERIGRLHDADQNARNAGPEHLVRAGRPAHLQLQGHIVTAIHIIEDDPAYPPAEIRTAFERAMNRFPRHA